MKAYLPHMNETILQSLKLQFQQALDSTGFAEGAPDECIISTSALNLILNELDPVPAAVITMWASNQEQQSVEIPMSYADFHKQVLHTLVRMVYAVGFAEGYGTAGMEVVNGALDEMLKALADKSKNIDGPLLN